MQSSKGLKVFFSITLSCVCTNIFAAIPNEVTTTNTNNRSSIYVGLLYLQPSSSNLKYAVFVSGDQPLSQSWHNQTLKPSYSPALELGYQYGIPQSLYNASIDWIHLHTNDSSSKQASQNTDVSTVEFVAPAYDVGPAVFGIKRGASRVKFNFDSIELNFGKNFEFSPSVVARLFGGINVLRINQMLTTTFSDFAGTPPTSLSYGLTPDPFFNFQTKNVSKYLGAGPDLGFNVQYKSDYGVGVVGQFLGTLTAGTNSVTDNFSSRSTRLLVGGMLSSQQSITAPDMTQVVPGFDAKLGLLYNHAWQNFLDVTIEAGYRMAYYMNAISDINPATLVQSGHSTITPEFATGTMAINSTDARNRPFSLNGPYIDIQLALA